METKEILSFIDIGEVKTIDELKEKFNEKFAPKSEVDDLNKKLASSTGKVTGAFNTNIKRAFGLTSEELGDKKWEDALELGVTKLKAENEELKKSVGQGGDKALEKANTEIENYKKTLKEEREAKEALQSNFEKTTGEYEGKLKGLKIGNVFENAKSKVIPKLKSDMSTAEKIGFESVIKEIIVDFDDKDLPVVKDKEGNRLKNPSKAGAFLSLEEALELKANELNLIKKNNGSGSAGLNMFQTPQQQVPVDPNLPVRRVHPNVAANIERLKTLGKQ